MESSNVNIQPFKGPWSKTQILHLLRRSLFGVKVSDWQFFQNKTLDECLDVLLRGDEHAPPPPIAAYMNDVKDPYVAFGQPWVDAPPVEEEIDFSRNYNFQGWQVNTIINQEKTITEKMTLFWQNHFSTNCYVVKDARYSYKHNQLLRKHALGNFKTLIREVTTDPCMLVFLNGNTNIKGKVNENYGRELQELYTLGKGADSKYTEEDVKTAARVLSGWTDEKVKISAHFDPNNHDESDKKFSSFYDNAVIKGRSGKDGAEEIDELINLIFTRQEASRFICRKLYRWFVNSNIDEKVEREVINPLSEVMVASGYEIKPVLRALFSSEHFYDTAILGCMIKSPADYLIGLLRQFEIGFPPLTSYVMRYESLYAVSLQLAVMRQDLAGAPTVSGWPAYYESPAYYKNWVDSDTLGQCTWITSNLISGVKAKDWTFKFDLLGFAAKFSEPSDADKIIDEIFNMLWSVSPKASTKSKFKTIFDGNADGSSWTKLWHSYTQSPEDTKIKTQVNSRLQSLLVYIFSSAEFHMM